MCSPIHEGPYPGPCCIRACTAAHVSVWAHALQGPRQMGGATAMPPPQDFRKLWLSHKYRQTHNLLIIHLEFFAERLQGTIWDIFRALLGASRMPPGCLPDASRCLLDASQMFPRQTHNLLIMQLKFLASQMPPGCLPDAFQMLSMILLPMIPPQ